MSNRFMTRLRAFGTAALAALSTLVLIGDKVKAVNSSSLLAHAYVLGGLFRGETVLLLLLIACFPWILSTFQGLRGIRATLGEWPRTSLRDRVFLIGFLLTASVSAAVLAYQAPYYVSGKRLLLERYYSVAIARASSAFESGDLTAARWSLRACVDVMRDERCKEVLESFDRRLLLARDLKALAGGTARLGPSYMALLRNAAQLDRNVDAYNAAVRQRNEQMRTLQGRFRQALTEIRSGRSDAGLKDLEAVNKEFPGFGNAHRIIEELRARRQGSGPRLFAGALARYGVDETVLDLAHVEEIPEILSVEELSENEW